MPNPLLHSSPSQTVRLSRVASDRITPLSNTCRLSSPHCCKTPPTPVRFPQEQTRGIRGVVRGVAVLRLTLPRKVTGRISVFLLDNLSDGRSKFFRCSIGSACFGRSLGRCWHPGQTPSSHPDSFLASVSRTDRSDAPGCDRRRQRSWF